MQKTPAAAAPSPLSAGRHARCWRARARAPSLLQLALGLGTVMVLSTFAASAQAQTKVRFQLDWRFEGPSALFLLGEQKGYYKGGSSMCRSTPATARATSSTAWLPAPMTWLRRHGFGDGVLRQQPGREEQAGSRDDGHNNTPAAVLALKKSAIRAPRDLAGKRLGAPVFDAGRRAFPIFAKANGLQAAAFNWQAMDPTLRETMLVRGDLDAITGFTFTLDPESQCARREGHRGAAISAVRREDVRQRRGGVRGLPEEEPRGGQGFLRAFAKSARDVIAHPEEGVKAIKARDGIIDEKLELKRLKIALDGVVKSPDARAEGFGRISKPRLSLMASQVADAFATRPHQSGCGLDRRLSARRGGTGCAAMSATSAMLRAARQRPRLLHRRHHAVRRIQPGLAGL